MEPERRREIEETVIDVLKKADLDTATEFTVRAAASCRLGMDLADIEHKEFVRGVVESFLLSTMDAAGEEAGTNGRGENMNVAQEAPPEVTQKKEVDGHGNRVICKLSSKRSVVIQDFSGKSFVSIREFYLKDGRHLQSSKGISLTAEQWSAFRKSVPSIEDAIIKMQSKLRSDHGGEQNEQVPNCEQNEQVPNSVTADATHELVPTDIRHFDGKSDLGGEQNERVDNGEHKEQNEEVPNGERKEQVSNSVAAAVAAATTTHEPIHIEINRFDGKNYRCWAQQMEFFLKQLNIAYVLTDPCPSVSISLEASTEKFAHSKSAERKWLNDDYICRRNILNSLSDALYYRYAKKTKSAKELWEELRLVYLYEEFGTKRSQVKKYIEFQMVDGKPILNQVQELNSIADSIVATGIYVDENFHVSAIISKLPESLKDFCIKLMREEYLPLWKLMDCVRVEEESHNPEMQGEISNMASNHRNGYLGLRMRDMKKPGMHWRRQEPGINNRVFFCHFCGKKGHISKHCRNK